MSSRMQAYVAVALASVAAGHMVGCEGVTVNLPFDEDVPAAARIARELRYKREVGSSDRHQATYTIRVRGNPGRGGYLSERSAGMEIDEVITADLIMYYTGKTETSEPFDRVVLQRRDETRKRLEVAPNGRVKSDSKPLNTQPRFTPNFAPEPSIQNDKIVYVPMNALGCIPTTKLYPYHYAWDDSLCYMFPVFPKQAVGVGDSWEYKAPVIVGLEYANNVTTLHARFTMTDLRRLQQVPGKPGPVCAVIDYTYYALLDSAVDGGLPVLADNQPGVLRRRDVVEGSGKAYFDVENGVVQWRTERYRIEVQRETRQPVKDDKREEPGERAAARRLEVVPFHSKVEIDFASRLLSMGERASDRPSRIDQ